MAARLACLACVLLALPATGWARNYYCWFGNRNDIGVQLCRDARTGLPRVVTPLRGGPAHRADVQAGDLIVAIYLDSDNNQNPPEPATVIETLGLSPAEVKKKLIGPRRTRVTLL